MTKNSIYSDLNLCGDAGSLAAQAAMYTDILITEDANLFKANFGRLTHDEIKFFNAIQKAAMNAIEEARGIPEDARASLQATLHSLLVRVDTRWGMPKPISTKRCALQGLGVPPRHPNQAKIPSSGYGPAVSSCTRPSTAGEYQAQPMLMMAATTPTGPPPCSKHTEN